MIMDWKKHSDKVIAIAATITAAVALLVAVLEVRGQQEFQKLSVEPYIELGNSGGSSIGHYAFLMINNGLGPGIIRSGSFTVDGIEMNSWNHAVRTTTENESLYDSTYSSIYRNRRIKASETIEVFKIAPYEGIAQEFHEAMSTGRVEYEICYCSIYEDCWRSSFKEIEFHVPVHNCEADR